MLVTVTPLAKPIPGIDFPVDHDTYPNDCENVACTKIGGHYRPGSWVIITQEFNKFEDEFFKTENYVCTECASGAKKSFMGYKILRRHEVEPVLKSVAPPKAEIAVSKPLTWAMKPKKEVPKTEQTMPIKISAPKVKVPERPKNKKLPPVPERLKEKKTATKAVSEKVRPPVTPETRPHVTSPTKVEKKKTKEPSPERKKNDRNASNPRPGSIRQIIDSLTAAQYAMVKRQKEKLEAKKDLEQHEAFFKLKRAREREYYKVEEFLIDLELNFVVLNI